ncbi:MULTISPECIES: AraC family transcriptional regulator [unclassified Achromobacter]|uniref:AraC family transcriptional regulator n=1 Tax=unclassified Achromobacter TaxID=2626865 RepID=UPI000B5179A6|nr:MULTISPECIES: AraC family transcriptional regulator [unclassified Achromobacter]OWT75474.1 AraC family transcriptional regulator [Achromobacter sp. HZ28]OWT76134.1 AraC family transcriptional regulator [Achromobacter sp. HZ34]
MDWLSRLLELAPVTGQVDIRCRFGAPWRIEQPPAGEGEIPYHVVLSGTALLDRDGAPPLRLQAGDVLLFPQGAAHALHDGSGKPGQAIRSRAGGSLEFKETAAGGADLDLLCGRFLIHPQQGHLIRDYLPPQLVIRPVLGDIPLGADLDHTAGDGPESAQAPAAASDASDASNATNASNASNVSAAAATADASDVSARRLRQLLLLMRNEASGDGLGGRALLNALSAALFALVLRHASVAGAEPAGLLAVAGEPRLAPALDAMFQDAAHPWTLEDLAQRCNMSRATFVRHFQSRIGRPAMALLTDIRMALALDHLKKTAMSTAAVAEAVGYQSEAAFQRAFKQHTGNTPAAWRAAARATPLR